MCYELHRVQDKSESRCSYRNDCYHLVQTLFILRLHKLVKIGMDQTVILPVLIYICVKQFSTQGEGSGLKVIENRVLLSLFESKKDKMSRG
jgi:hypothetical protein